MRRAITAVIVTAATVTAAAPAGADPPTTGYALVFSDEFNGTAPDTAKWNFRTDVKAGSAQLARNVTVANGVMTINLKQEAVQGKNWTGGGLVSKRAFRYGYYETRAKIATVGGWHTSFWLQAGNGTTTFPPEQRTEIDVLENDSANQRTVHSGVITWKGSGVHGPISPGTTYDSGLDLRQWHTYGVDWSETSAKYYVDGVLRYTAPYSPSQWTHDYLNVWLTSIAYPESASGPSVAQFDYVRYWQKDYYLDNDGPAAYGYSETGTWLDSALAGWNYGSPSRYATCHAIGNTATWRPNLNTAGTYQVSVHKIAHSGSDPNGRYDVVHNGATSTTYVNGTNGASGWVSLGTYSFPAGTSGYVKLTASGTGCARADAVKFVRA
ncbi:MAG: family 16 glycosylhydrolase [Actinophytocola sp.]|uniref:glycoside hydrolase family 16 protein n=1 Tax=Actinophytocola sp. TaxID=1872138 RepID=UPI0013274496|nr:glycoside hydrolase family 16 protein [Actinophytocola sp.]MPZ82184.1 family 16 glycosylhydrolase [Actinophytocola sp.]